MSQENVEVVRRMLIAASSGDAMAGATYFDPAIVWDLSGVVGWPENPVYSGLEEVGPFLRSWVGSFATWHFDLVEIRPASGDRVFAAIHEWGVGAESGAKVDQHRYLVCSVRASRTLQVRMFSERGEALKAVGLDE
jgi:hypothetical protein